MAAAPDPDEVLRSTTGKGNFQRVARLLISGGATLLREIFDLNCPPSDLPKKLNNPATEKQLKSAKLTKPQWDCLYPSPGVYGKSTDFDVTLLFRLLRTIFGLIPPSTGWDALPTSTDHSLTADLARIKYYRNSVYGHVKQNMEITDDEFPRFWQEIGEALVRIAGQISPAKKIEWQEAIDKFLKDPLTAEDERNVQELLTWYRNDMEIKESIEKLKSSTQDVQEGVERVETSLKGVQLGIEGTTQVIEEKAQCLETAVREEAKDIKDKLGEELRTTTRDVREGMEHLGTSFKGVQRGLEGTTQVIEEKAQCLETAVREETKDIKDQLGEMHQSIDRLSSSAGWAQAAGVQLRVRIDCEAIAAPGPHVEASEMLVEEGGPLAVDQGTAVIPIASGKPQAEATGGPGVVDTSNDGLPSSQKVLNFIALKSFRTVDPSKPEELNGFLQYMEKIRKVLILDVQPGSLIITVGCSSLEILEGLWDAYCAGHLNEMAQLFLVTDNILKEFGLIEVKLTTTILEEEYRACREYFLQSPAKNLEPLGQSAGMAFKKYTEKDKSLFKKLQENRTEQEELQQRLNALKEHERQMEEESETQEKADIEDQVSVPVPIDPRVHRRLIGTKGRTIRKFMETYKVDIRFPSLNTSDPVVISGLAENVEEAKDQLLLLEEEYMQDVRDEIEQHDVVSHYLNPPSKQSSQVGFVVRDAPWDKAQNADGGGRKQKPQREPKPPPPQQSNKEKPLPPDTSNIADFPCIGSSTAAPRPTAWGPTRR